MSDLKGILSKLPGVAALGAVNPVFGSAMRKLTKDNAPAMQAQDDGQNAGQGEIAKAQRDAANRIRMSQGLPAMKKGGSVSSASKRADGIAQKGKTRGKIC